MRNERRSKRLWSFKLKTRLFNMALIIVITLFAFNLYFLKEIIVTPKGVLVTRLYFLTLMVSLSAVTIILLAVFLIIIHRTTGALYRIEEDLDKVTGGNYSMRIALRKKDFLQSLVVKLNKIIGLLEPEAKN